MILISNNCFSGFYYKNLNLEYNHPLFWGIMSEKDLLFLIKNYKTINWNNFSFNSDNELKIPVCTLDKNINYFYTHYAYSESDNVPRFTVNEENGARNVWYKNNLEYAKEKYEKRIKRIDKNAIPAFVIIHDFTFDKRIHNENTCSDKILLRIVDLCNKNKYKLIVFTVKRDFLKIKNTKYVKWLNIDDFGYLHKLEEKYQNEVTDFINS